MSDTEEQIYHDELLSHIRAMIREELKAYKPDLGVARNTLPGQNLPTGGDTGSGYTPAPHTHPAPAWTDITGKPSTFPPGGAAGGDLSGTYPNPGVAKIGGRTVGGAAPDDGQALVWVAANNQYEPGDVAASGGAAYAETIGDGVATTFVVTHSLGTRDVLVAVQNLDTYAYEMPGIAATTTNTVTITFDPSFVPDVDSFRVIVSSGGGGGGGGGAALTIEEVDGTPTTSATKLIFPNGTLGLVGTEITYTPAAVTAAPYLPLDVPPGSAHAKDDEFGGVALDGKWSDISSGSGLQWTKTVANGWLIAEPAQSGSASTGKRLMGIRQNAPAGAFTISAKLAGTYRADDTREGIFVAEGTRMNLMGYDVSNNNILAHIGSNTYSETVDAGAYDGVYTTALGYRIPVTLWVKIVWIISGGTLNFYYSLTGVTWTLHTTRTGMNQPTRIGLAQYSQNSAILAADHQFGCDWFRVTEP